jgi:hypothetical protein
MIVQNCIIDEKHDEGKKVGYHVTIRLYDTLNNIKLPLIKFYCSTQEMIRFCKLNNIRYDYPRGGKQYFKLRGDRIIIITVAYQPIGSKLY